MSILKIYTFPNQILKKRAEPVTIFDHDIDEISKSMLDTMYISGGIGLAAIQVGITKRIIVIDLKSGVEDLTEREPHILVNPEIVEKSGATVSEEGCLSVIDFRCEIERSQKITLEYQDITGKKLKMDAENMMSICIQHEIDHLNGILFIDHLPYLKQKLVKKRLAKLAKVEK